MIKSLLKQVIKEEIQRFLKKPVNESAFKGPNAYKEAYGWIKYSLNIPHAKEIVSKLKRRFKSNPFGEDDIRQIMSESVNEDSRDEDLLKQLYKQRAKAASKGQTGLVSGLHKQIEKLVKSIKENELVNEGKKYGWDDILDVLMTVRKGARKIIDKIKMNDTEVKKLLKGKYDSYLGFAKAVKSMYNLNEAGYVDLQRKYGDEKPRPRKYDKEDIYDAIRGQLKRGTISRYDDDLRDKINSYASKFEIQITDDDIDWVLSMLDESIKESIKYTKSYNGRRNIRI